MSATSTITGVIASTWWRTAKSLTCNTPSTTPLFGLGKMQWSGRVPMCFTNWASYMRISRRLCGDLKNNHCYFNCPVVWNDPFPHYFLIDYWLWDWFCICLIPPTNLNVSAVATVRSKCVMNSTFYLPVIIECGKQLIYQRKVLSCSTNVHCTRGAEKKNWENEFAEESFSVVEGLFGGNSPWTVSLWKQATLMYRCPSCLLHPFDLTALFCYCQRHQTLKKWCWSLSQR